MAGLYASGVPLCTMPFVLSFEDVERKKALIFIYSLLSFQEEASFLFNHHCQIINMQNSISSMRLRLSFDSTLERNVSR